MATPELWSADMCKAHVDRQIPHLREIIMDETYRAAVNHLIFAAQPSARRPVSMEWLAGFIQFDKEMRELLEAAPKQEDVEPWAYDLQNKELEDA